MKATILLGTLKKSGLSNTETLCEFLVRRMEREGVRCERGESSDYPDSGEAEQGGALNMP